MEWQKVGNLRVGAKRGLHGNKHKMYFVPFMVQINTAFTFSFLEYFSEMPKTRALNFIHL